MALRVTKVGLQVGGYRDNSGRVVPLPTETLYSSLERNNWISGVQIERAWQTDVTMSQGHIAEERWGLRKRPLISQRAQFTGMDQNASADLLIHLARQAQNGNPVPIYPDRTRLTAAYTSGTRIYCDTTRRRFFLGQRIALVPKDWDIVAVAGAYAPVEYDTISAITSTYIDLDNGFTAPPGSYDLGSWVFPLFDAEPILNTRYTRPRRDIIDATVQWVERSGGNTIPSLLSSPHVAQASFEEYDGLPILDASMNGSLEGGVVREGQRYSTGRSSDIEVYGEINRFVITAEFKFITRFHWWRFASFFDLMQGRKGAFWFINPQRLWELVSVQSSTVFRVKRTHYYHVFDPTLSAATDAKPSWFNHFALVESDGRVNIAQVTSVAEVSIDTWDITVDAALPTTNIRRITAAHKARFFDDAMTETWITFDVVTTSMTLYELHSEESVTVG